MTQPLPPPRIQGGTRSSTDAVHRTLVLPMDTRTDPGANSVKSRTKVTGRRLGHVPAVGPQGPGGRSQRVPPAHGGLLDAAPEGRRSPRPGPRPRRTVGQRWVTTSRRAPAPPGVANRLVCPLMCWRALRIRWCRWPRTGRGRARGRGRRATTRARSPQSSRARPSPFEPHGQGDRAVVGAAEGEPQLTDVHPSPSPTSCQSRIPSTSWVRRSSTPGAA